MSHNKEAARFSGRLIAGVNPGNNGCFCLRPRKLSPLLASEAPLSRFAGEGLK